LARAAGRLVGVGVACYTEYTGMGAAVFRRRGMVHVPGIEAATVTMGADGTVSCVTSFPSQGQGHATTIAQLVADRLGISMDAVRVLAVDTLAAPRGSGTFGSRGAVSMLGSAAVAAERVREKLQALAAHCLEASPSDVTLEEGRAWVRGAPHRAVMLSEVTRLAYAPPPGGSARRCSKASSTATTASSSRRR